MRALATFLITIMGMVSCKSNGPTQSGVPTDSLWEQKIQAVLKNVPPPLPESTPYDRDTRQREVFDAGFRAGWNCGISGSFLHGTYGTPMELAKEARDIRTAWSAGWDAGLKMGADRWLRELKRPRDVKGRQPIGDGLSR